jgi:hypothetical protein
MKLSSSISTPPEKLFQDTSLGYNETQSDSVLHSVPRFFTCTRLLVSTMVYRTPTTQPICTGVKDVWLGSERWGMGWATWVLWSQNWSQNVNVCECRPTVNDREGLYRKCYVLYCRSPVSHRRLWTRLRTPHKTILTITCHMQRTPAAFWQFVDNIVLSCIKTYLSRDWHLQALTQN